MAAAPANPFMKFYPQDWRADEKLRNCSLAARGLWVEMLALMHRSERYGHLVINGSVPTHEQLAVQAGAPLHEVTALLAELDNAGVFSRSANGSIYSRRMTRDAKKAKIARQNGKTGGNPNLGKQTGNPASDNLQDKPEVKPPDKPQIPEARGQRLDSPKPPASLPPDARAAMEAAGFTAPTGDMMRRLREWQAAGATIDQDIVPVIRREVERLKAKGDRPRTFTIFDAAIREKLDADQREIEHLERVALRNQDQPASAAGGA